ncbi:hypothetical protein Z517_11128 [Fonsecaea pedrosoi CBS 271.37]|uniref:Mid2 domain-containing protein n=1 Tax=Fonsecaea pedrosoi CBS 271.37 TaxID=1442368 RepID=A0A0D2EPX0_9EURO|nr:uncharacterized protein Z517_11128 [Fonsecaea pedrosoi CBS 271.37]KIW76382.1 hypothetical protein Z517_11128 [Fonsecaea pedrosoi CBS 271.37]
MSFVFPPPAPAEDPVANSASYGIGSSLAISWTDTNSTWSNATLVLMKNDGNNTCTLLNLGAAYCQAIQPSFSASDSHGFSWRVSTYDYPQYPTDTNPFYYLIMGAFDSSGLVNKFYSHGFFIYPPDSVPSVTYAGSTSSTTVTSTPDSSTTTTTTSSSITLSLTSSTIPSTTAGASSGLDTGTKTAIGVAVGLGIPLVIALIFIAFLFFKKRQNQPPAPDLAPATTGNEQISKHLSESSRNGSESWATTGMRYPSELSSGPIPIPQPHGWQSQNPQPYLSELSANRRSSQ